MFSRGKERKEKNTIMKKVAFYRDLPSLPLFVHGVRTDFMTDLMLQHDNQSRV